MIFALCSIAFFAGIAVYAAGRHAGFKVGCGIWRPVAESYFELLPKTRRMERLSTLEESRRLIRALKTNLPSHAYDLALDRADEVLRKRISDEVVQ